MRLSVVAASREDDRPPEEALTVAVHADRLGYPEVWVGEGPTWDAFVLATAIGLATDQIAITVGPLPVSVRDPATIVRGAAGTEALTGRPTGVALGTASKRVVEGVHGRSRAGAAATLEQTAEAARRLTGGRGSTADPISDSFRRRLAPPSGPLTVAAFGDRAIATAAQHADRMLLDVVSPEQVRTLRTKLDLAAQRAGRRAPVLGAWLPTAIDPDPASTAQLRQSLAGYLAVRGYREMFLAAGLGGAVALADRGTDAAALAAALPEDAADRVGLVGDLAHVRARIERYADAGLDEVAIVPATAGDPGGVRTLTAVAALL